MASSLLRIRANCSSYEVDKGYNPGAKSLIIKLCGQNTLATHIFKEFVEDKIITNWIRYQTKLLRAFWI